MKDRPVLARFCALLPLLAGAMLPLAFSPFDYFLLAPLSLAMLFRVWQRATPTGAAGAGYLFGLGFFGVGVSWVYVSMHQYGGASVFAALALTAVFIAFLALFPALTGYLAARLCKRRDWFWLLAVGPALWVAAEWVRGWFLTGFPWLQLGYSQLEAPLAGFAPVLGVYGSGWLLALCAALALAGLQQRRWRRFPPLVLIAIIWGTGAQLREVAWSEPAGKPFVAALLQGNIDQNQKWQPENRRHTLQMYAAMTRQHWGADVIVWPETAVPAFYQQVRESFFEPLRQEARAHGSDLLFGVPVLNTASQRYYNALVSLGESEGIYRKRHLVPFGEYLPLQPFSGFILDILEIPLSDFSAGDGRQALLRAAGYPLVASICYEDVFGQESLQGLPQAAYLVNVSNDAWFSGSIAPYQHLQMARMRALETRRYMLRATNTGLTAIIGPDGRLLNMAPPYQRASLQGKVTPLQGETPYVRFGDGPVLALLLALLAVATIRGYRSAAC